MAYLLFAAYTSGACAHRACHSLSICPVCLTEPGFPILCHHCANESQKHISYLFDLLIFQRSEASSWVVSSWLICCSSVTKAVLKEVSLPCTAQELWKRFWFNKVVRLLGWTSHLGRESSCKKALLHFHQLVTCISSLDLLPKLQTQIYNFFFHPDVTQAPQTHHSIDGDANCPLLLETEPSRF